ncbi:hypothetical protein, partial [Pseudomonas gingeri]
MAKNAEEYEKSGQPIECLSVCQERRSVDAGGRKPQNQDTKKGPTFRLTLSDRPAERILSGRRDWTRTNDPHHVKVVL